MFVKYYIVFSLILSIQLTFGRSRAPKFSVVDDDDDETLGDHLDTSVTRPPALQVSRKPPVNPTEIDVKFYYRISNVYAGTTKALEIQPSANTYGLQMSPISRKYSQQFYFVPFSDGSFAIRSRKLGDEFSLDVINDSSKSRVIMASSGDYSGQSWRIIPSTNQSYRFFNDFTAEEKALDIFNDNQVAHLSDASAFYGGQFWKLQKLGPLENF